MKELHPWDVDVQRAIQIQETLRDQLLLKKTFSQIKTIGGADVSYSNGNHLLGMILVFSYPDLKLWKAFRLMVKLLFDTYRIYWLSGKALFSSRPSGS